MCYHPNAECYYRSCRSSWIVCCMSRIDGGAMLVSSRTWRSLTGSTMRGHYDLF